MPVFEKKVPPDSILRQQKGGLQSKGFVQGGFGGLAYHVIHFSPETTSTEQRRNIPVTGEHRLRRQGMSD